MTERRTTVTVTLRLKPDMLAAVDELAARERHDRSTTPRLLIADGLLGHRYVLDHEGGLG